MKLIQTTLRSSKSTATVDNLFLCLFFAMHFRKAFVWGFTLAAVNAAALPADSLQGSITCDSFGGKEACEALVRTTSLVSFGQY